MPVPLVREWKTGVALGFRSIGKNWACAGGKMLPEVMCCLEREKKPRPNRLQIRKFRIVAPCKWPPFYI